MNPLLSSLSWCAFQVTLVALAAWFLCLIARRVSPRHDSVIPATALACILVLTLLAFVPLPAAWTYGLTWSFSTANIDSVDSVKAEESRSRVPVPANRIVVDNHPSPSAATPAGHVGDETSLRAIDASGEPAHISAPVTLSNSAPANAALQTSAPNSLARIWQTMVLIALSGWALVGLLQLVGGLLAARSYRRSSRLIQDQPLGELVDVLCAELLCTTPIELRETATLATAATIGWRRPLILLPLEWRSWNDAQRRAVLAHEIAHVARQDFLACVLAQASLALHFYHPLVHWLVSRLRLEQELAADALAAGVAGGDRNYLQTLAELALRQTERPLGWPARTFLPTPGTFMRRIEMLRDTQQGRTGKHGGWRRRLAVVVLIAGTVAAAGLRGAGNPVSSPVLAQDDKPVKQALTLGVDGLQATAINVAHVPNDAVLFAALRPGQLLKHPELAEVFTKLDQSVLHWEAAGIALAKIEQVTVLMQIADGRMGDLLIVSTTEPVNFGKLATSIVGQGKAVAEYQPNQAGPAFSRLSDTVAVMGQSHSIETYLAGQRGEPAVVEGKAWEKVRNSPFVAVVDMRLARTQPGLGLSAVDGNPELSVFSPLVQETETIVIGVTAEKQFQVYAATDCLGRNGADQVKGSVVAGAVAARNIMRMQRNALNLHAAQNIGVRAVPEPDHLRTLLDAVDKALSNVTVEQDDTLITAQAKLELKVRGVSTLGSLIPSVATARKSASKAVAANNVKQIILAMHNYADTFKGFPPAAGYGWDGKCKYPSSWRVQLLPFLGQAPLYNEYKFDEPWDSESNKKILARMPAVFRAPGDDPQSTTSSYYVVIGKAAGAKVEVKPSSARTLRSVPPGGGAAAPAVAPAAGGPQPNDAQERRPEAVVVDVNLPTAFSKQGGQLGITFGEILDGTSNTIAIVEARRDIPWTKPEDITFDPNGKLPELGGIFADGFHVGICDGTVNFLSTNINPELLKAYLTPAKGDQIAPIKDPRPSK